MTTIHTLASGSSGNAALVSRNGTHVLLDAGISCRRITAALGALGLGPGDLSAVLITHTHSDHISGLATLVKNWDIPVCASRRTCGGLADRVVGIHTRLRPFDWEENLQIGSLEITPFPTAHDAPGSAGYRFGEAGILTDTGYVTAEAADALRGVGLLVLEANHDVNRLRSGPYPAYLKRRILGEDGHLSNDAAAAFAVEEAAAGAGEIVLAHLSRENNTPELALRAVSEALGAAGFHPEVRVAPRDTLSVSYAAKELVCSE
ncbi:MAG: MBL fold metallo-hydrolase [Oscillibacter sp.]|nr:MBL fold metallo-hydrolase [Oscillibacter sp.]